MYIVCHVKGGAARTNIPDSMLLENFENTVDDGQFRSLCSNKMKKKLNRKNKQEKEREKEIHFNTIMRLSIDRLNVSFTDWIELNSVNVNITVAVRFYPTNFPTKSCFLLKSFHFISNEKSSIEFREWIRVAAKFHFIQNSIHRMFN